MSIGQEGSVPSGYERFFGFVEAPFSLAVNTRFRFDSASHREALSQVSYALERREPIVVVTGEIGTGKTLLCRTVLERLPRKTFLSVINDPKLGRDDLLKRILEDFGVISSAGVAVVQTSRHDLVHALERFVASLGQLDAHAVIILDEAQHVRADVLEELRLIANIHDGRGTLLQIVLVGQPSLRALLDARELEQLRQRIARFVSLDSLNDNEVRLYISHRLTVARETPTNSSVPGARDLAAAIAEWNELSQPPTFTDEAVTAVARISRGVPRLVNLVCDRALETACAQQARTVSAAHVNTAASLLQLPAGENPIAGEASIDAAELPAAASSSRRPLVGAAAAGFIVAFAAAVWIGGRAMNPSRMGEQKAAVAASASPRPPAATAPRPAAPPPAQSIPAEVRPATAPPNTTSPIEESYELVVASFRTEARANEVARQIAAMGQKVRQRSLGGWQQVLAGPFASKEAAGEAQQQLSRAGFTQTVIVRENR